MPKILAIDLDGTLLYPKSRKQLMPLRNITFLRDYIDQGGEVLLVTSRGPAYIDRIIKMVERQMDYISFNSTIVSIRGQRVRDLHFSNEAVKSITDHYRRQYLKPMQAIFLMTEAEGMVINRRKTCLITQFGTWVWHRGDGKYAEQLTFNTKKYNEQLAHGKIYKIIAYNGLTKYRRNQASVSAESLKKDFPDIEVAWIDYLTEVTPQHCNKAEGIKFYLESRGLTTDDIAVVGDSGNDIPMFELVPDSYCMSHGPKFVQEKAKHIINYVYDLAEFFVQNKEEKKN